MLTIYSKVNCPFCVSSKELLDSYGVEYEERKIDDDQEALMFLMDRGLRGVPQFYVGEEVFVEGSWDGIKAMSKEDVLNRLAELEGEA